MVIPDQDKVIYSRLTQDTIPAKVEKLFPEEEKPVMIFNGRSSVFLSIILNGSSP